MAKEFNRDVNLAGTAKLIKNGTTVVDGSGFVPAARVGTSTTALTATVAEINRAADTSGRLVAAGATLAVTEALHDGKTILLNTAAGSICTLPAATGSGARFRFIVSVIATSNSHVVKVANSTDVMYGLALTLQDGGDTLVAFETGATSDTITFNRTTTGSTQIGEMIECEDIVSGKWYVKVNNVATGTEATPFSATV